MTGKLSSSFGRAAVLTLTAGLAWAMAPAPASALDGQLLTLNTCTTLNCKAVEVTGRVNGFGGKSNPWVGSFAASPLAKCLRLHIVGESADLEMSVVAPDGSIFTNDDPGGTCPNCPRVVINPISVQGYYTVVINFFSGQPVEAGFRLLVGQYKQATNPNCAGPTPPLFDAATERKAAKLEAAR